MVLIGMPLFGGYPVEADEQYRNGRSAITFGVSIIASTCIAPGNNAWYQRCYCCNMCTNDLQPTHLVRQEISSHTRGTYVKAASD